MIRLVNKLVAGWLFVFFGVVGFSLSTHGQTTSFAFQKAMPPGVQEVTSVDTTLFGTYTNASGFTYVFNEEGIFSQSTLLLYISEKMVRDSSKYEVRDNYLFGVVEDDSVICELKDGVYYYGLKELIPIHGKDKKTVLTKEKDTYYLNYKEGNMYIPTRFTFEENKLSVCQFDYENETTAFEAIKKSTPVKEGNITHYLLSPTRTEWNGLDTKAIFSETEVFIKQ